ncbi:MAG TPA: hypothetical protein VFZ66_26910 [Herpetosiphonaceae bacterium]
MYAMTGGTAHHNLIVANIIALLHGQLRGSSCGVFPSDLRLKYRTNRIIYISRYFRDLRADLLCRWAARYRHEPLDSHRGLIAKHRKL